MCLIFVSAKQQRPNFLETIADTLHRLVKTQALGEAMIRCFLCIKMFLMKPTDVRLNTFSVINGGGAKCR